ncbi:hypothetical protein ACLVL5_05905 [Streptococcus pneumoniae]
MNVNTKEHIKSSLEKMADKLCELANCPEDINYVELGDWFYNSGSEELYDIAAALNLLAEGIE